MNNIILEPLLEESSETISLFVADLNGSQKVAKILAEVLAPGEMIGLSGELGAGKTEFVRLVLRELGVTEDVVSPSFVLEAIYQGQNSLNINEISHWDLYRLNGMAGVSELEEYKLKANSVTFIEWPESGMGVGDLLSAHILLKFIDAKTVIFREKAWENQRKLEINFKDHSFKRRFLKNLSAHGIK